MLEPTGKQHISPKVHALKSMYVFVFATTIPEIYEHKAYISHPVYCALIRKRQNKVFCVPFIKRIF